MEEQSESERSSMTTIPEELPDDDLWVNYDEEFDIEVSYEETYVSNLPEQDEERERVLYVCPELLHYHTVGADPDDVSQTEERDDEGNAYLEILFPLGRGTCGMGMCAVTSLHRRASKKGYNRKRYLLANGRRLQEVSKGSNSCHHRRAEDLN